MPYGPGTYGNKVGRPKKPSGGGTGRKKKPAGPSSAKKTTRKRRSM